MANSATRRGVPNSICCCSFILGVVIGLCSLLMYQQRYSPVKAFIHGGQSSKTSVSLASTEQIPVISRPDTVEASEQPVQNTPDVSEQHVEDRVPNEDRLPDASVPKPVAVAQPAAEPAQARPDAQTGLPEWCRKLKMSSKGDALDEREKMVLCRRLSAFLRFDYGHSSTEAFEDRLELLKTNVRGMALCDVKVAVFNAHKGWCDGFGDIAKTFMYAQTIHELQCSFDGNTRSLKTSVRVGDSGLNLLDGDHFLNRGSSFPQFDIAVACVSISQQIMDATLKHARVKTPVLIRDMFSDHFLQRQKGYKELMKHTISVSTFLPDSEIQRGFGGAFISSIKKPDHGLKGKSPSLAPIVHISSHCGVPFRDNFVRELMKHIKVDSLGKCFNNKEQVGSKQSRYGEQTDEVVRQYKFMIAAENTDCDSYCSEKAWMPLARGTVPILHGCRYVKDFAPKNSVISSADFSSVKELAAYVQRLADDPAAYAKMLEWRHPGKEKGNEWQRRFATDQWQGAGGKAFYRILAESQWMPHERFGALLLEMADVADYVDLSPTNFPYKGKSNISKCRTPNPNEERYYGKVCRGRNKDLIKLSPATGQSAKFFRCEPRKPWRPRDL